jgi:GTP-binding protein
MLQFIDEAIIHVKAGDGGNGSAAMRREDNVPRGGPSGGDGGDGGSIIVITDAGMSSLLDFKYRRHFNAERGEDGRAKDQYGAAGPDTIIKVPVGTVITDADTEEQLVDLDAEGMRFVLCKGGIGGRGNIHFATPWNQAPSKTEQGTLGIGRRVRLELKLLADVGLLGYPNVGKSTFISAVSRARPKIGDYPFTTLTANLGVVQLSDERHMVIADIPGLIEGAADGAGLGHQFLRHVERCRVLLHILDATYTTGPTRDPLADYRVINAELAKYAPELSEVPQIVVLNKSDATDPDDLIEHKREFAAVGVNLLTMSAATGEGTQPVLEALWSHLAAARAK